MTEWQLFEPGTIPECTTPEWYADRESAPHADQPEHHGRLLLACDFVEDAVLHHGCTSIVDLGCGDGGLLAMIDERLITEADIGGRHISTWGYDLAPANVHAARAKRHRHTVTYGDVVNNPTLVRWGDLAIATEMLEHLVDPHEFVRRIRSRFLVASSPYTETDQSHYDYHTWAWDTDGYVKLMQQGGFEVLQMETWSMFQVVLAVKA